MESRSGDPQGERSDLQYGESVMKKLRRSQGADGVATRVSKTEVVTKLVPSAKADSPLPTLPTRHSRAGLSYAAANAALDLSVPTAQV